MDWLNERCEVTLHEGPEAIPRDRLLRDIAGKVGAITLLTDKVDDEFLDAAGEQLVIVANYAVGFDNIDVPACSARNVLASNTPDVLTETTAAMACRARGFGMKVIYFDVYRPPPELEEELNVEYRELDDLLMEADFITLHTNLSPESRHLINEERLKRMKPTADLVNTARGPVIDEAA